MDILDIDEALKDDSFIFLVDKTHDDVSNILQQWKTNNLGMPSQQNEQAYKLNSKTFTRPKRKSTHNLENQFSIASQQHQQNSSTIGPQHVAKPLLNLEIGGLVTNMHKSFLQDTSPPPSILSSMDLSMERMNNSLITSADFTNLSFLQTPKSLEFGNNENDLPPAFYFSTKATADGYTLSDMISDRKALETLTMSGDGTFIKDSHIAQIDDISLTLSKTASGCSTMDNSTDSVGVVSGLCGGIECNNQTIEINNQQQKHKPQDLNFQNSKGPTNATSQQSIVLSDEISGDMTFNLVENSMHGSCALNVTHDILKVQTPTSKFDSTFKKPATPFDDSVLLNNNNKINATFECQQEDVTPDAFCDTPENVDKMSTAMRFYESTPQTTNMRQSHHSNKQPRIKMIDDVNISPITAQNTCGQSHNATYALLNNTYETKRSATTQPQQQQLGLDTSVEPLGLPEFSENLEILDQVENPNETYNKRQLTTNQEMAAQQQLAEDARKQMQCVMDLAEAEVELLAQQNDEEQFEHMLDNLGRVNLNAEQIKMQKSLDSIKKRFNYNSFSSSSLNTTTTREISREAQDMRELTQHMQELLDGELEAENQEAMESKESTIRQGTLDGNKDASSSADLKSSIELSATPFESSHRSSALMINGQNGERLLSRRSRLYDDVNMSMLSSGNVSNLSAKSSTSSTSFTVQKEGDLVTNDTQPETETEVKSTQETEEPSRPIAATNEIATCYRLSEKRERDRDRFKTIKINKQRTEAGVSADGTELNVPCIDDTFECTGVGVNTYEVNELSGGSGVVAGAGDEQQMVQMQKPQRFSRRDRNTPEAVLTNNKSMTDQCKESETNLNYLTYKKPKDKLTKFNPPEVVAPPLSEFIAPLAAAMTRPEPRSISRPRYISGLQKFSVVSKATSAGDLPKTSMARATNIYGKSTQTQNHKQGKNAAKALSGTGELKSPMGIKSKSFHNLSSNFGIGSASGLTAPRASLSYGTRRPNNGVAGHISGDKQSKLGAFRGPTTSHATAAERNDEGVFKVPKLGLRAPNAVTSGAGNVKRSNAAGGLARPSSGYYSMNVIGNKTTQQQSAIEVEIEPAAGRHSPTESLSSASSRGSLYGGVATAKPTNSSASKVLDTLLTAKLTKVTTGGTGIPKPSGLRPPSNLKRSGLPRPSSIVRR